MEENENNEKKNNKSEETYKKISKINHPHESSKNNINLFKIDENESNCILYSDIKIDNNNFRNNINRATIMPSLPSKDINQNILKFNRIRIKNITAFKI